MVSCSEIWSSGSISAHEQHLHSNNTEFTLIHDFLCAKNFFPVHVAVWKCFPSLKLRESVQLTVAIETNAA